ncbi:MAG: hypothetical protein JNK92_06130 [Dechloromonas sp.]|nr:hypothetical protein [Dechloromonas sp.]
MPQSTIKALEVVTYPDGRMDTKNTSKYMGLAEKTLAMMRSNGTGPKFVKRGRVFYFQADVDVWMNAQGRHTSTAQAKHRAA